MLLYLYGQDSYRRGKNLAKIISEYQKKHSDLSSFHFDFENEGEFERLKEFSAGQSLFSKTKLAVIHGANEAPDDFHKFLKNFTEDKNTTLVIVADKKLAKDFAFLLKEPAKSWEFEPLEGATLKGFIKKEAQELGINASNDLIEGLILTHGDNLWGIVTDLEKISLGAGLEAASLSPNFFGMIQTLKNGNQPLGRRLAALDFLIEKNEPAMVFNMLASQLYGSEKIKMADYDISIKSGKLDYAEALLDFVLV